VTARFVEQQRRYSEEAEPGRFAWQTSAPYFSDGEASLVRGIDVAAGQRLLEIGCGEGSNLYHLRARGVRGYGIDFSPKRVSFARRATGATLAVADAARLPFAGESFDAVLIRDLLHHLPNPGRALDEAHRVLRPGGRLTVIEPNANSPLVQMQAAVIPAERGALRSTDEHIRTALERAGFVVEATRTEQPLPLGRVAFRLGAGGIGRLGAVARALSSIDAIAERIIPRRHWLYLTYQAVRT
jgi:SAM-dependent methyltransferase